MSTTSSIGNLNGLYILMAIVILIAIVLVILALVSLGPAVYNLAALVVDQFETFVAQVESFSVSVFNQISRVTATVAGTIGSLADILGGAIEAGLSQVDSLVQSLFRQVAGGMEQVVNIVGTLSESLYQTISSFGGKVLSILQDIGFQYVGRIINEALQIIQAILNFLAPLFELIKDFQGFFQKWIIGPITDFLGPVLGIINQTTQSIYALVEKFAGGILSGNFSQSGSSVLDAVSGVAGFVSSGGGIGAAVSALSSIF